MRNILKAISVAALSLSVIGGSAWAEDWAPSGPLTIQVGFGAGGSTDTLARIVGSTIKEQTGWSVIVENKPGAGGVAMLQGIVNRPADGTVIGVGVNMPIMVQLVQRGDQLGFDLDSFDLLGTISKAELAMLTSADSPYNNLAELIAYAKENGPMTAAFDAGPQKLLLELIGRESGVEFNMVSTKGGAEILQLLLGGQTQLGFGSGEILPYIESNRLKPLAALTPERLSYAPEIETVKEQGYDVFFAPYYFVAAAAGTPDDAREALEKALDDALRAPAVVKIVRNLIKNDPINLGPEGTRKMFDEGLINVQTLFQ